MFINSTVVIINIIVYTHMIVMMIRFNVYPQQRCHHHKLWSPFFFFRLFSELKCTNVYEKGMRSGCSRIYCDRGKGFTKLNCSLFVRETQWQNMDPDRDKCHLLLCLLGMGLVIVITIHLMRDYSYAVEANGSLTCGCDTQKLRAAGYTLW